MDAMTKRTISRIAEQPADRTARAGHGRVFAIGRGRDHLDARPRAGAGVGARRQLASFIEEHLRRGRGIASRQPLGRI